MYMYVYVCVYFLFRNNTVDANGQVLGAGHVLVANTKNNMAGIYLKQVPIPTSQYEDIRCQETSPPPVCVWCSFLVLFSWNCAILVFPLNWLVCAW